MKIGLDLMGGDFAPAEAIKGVQQYFEETSDEAVHLVLFGNPEFTDPYISLIQPYSSRYTFVATCDDIGMDEFPTKAMKEKTNSSIAKGFYYLHKGEIDTFISAGNTGAMLVGIMFSVKAVEGVIRPCIVSPVPRIDGGCNFMLDVGLNADCKPEHLVQFAQLGSLYAQHILGEERPTIGLMNVGEEEGKGNLLAQATYPLLKEQTDINFIGNIEGRDIFFNKARVIVCEGFLGNVVLKMSESVYEIFHRERKEPDAFLENFNFENYGGLPVLGINKPVLIMHGISHALAFKNIIGVASKFISSKLTEAIKDYFKQPEA
jgi:glycerol-3-phosphate acyltransferase PlsX